jgi:hypothetical protein
MCALPDVRNNKCEKTGIMNMGVLQLQGFVFEVSIRALRAFGLEIAEDHEPK